ncbi:hypothetical protein [Fodinibius saliphilus]|uniref:hypothetical protein n=1 Tax=Fodinibius saliphilus TaxID=1920650 RepID=UPI001107BC0E|nr:hypothetical protein [Fodinibius saliphilus]
MKKWKQISLAFFCGIMLPLTVVGQQPDWERLTKEKSMEYKLDRYSVYQTDFRFSGDLSYPIIKTPYEGRKKGYKNFEVNINRRLEEAIDKSFQVKRSSGFYQLLMLVAPFVNNRFEFGHYKAFDIPIISREQLRSWCKTRTLTKEIQGRYF